MCYYMVYIDCKKKKKALHVQWKLSQVSFAASSALKGDGGCNQIIYRVLYLCKYYLVSHLLLVLNLCKHCILLFFCLYVQRAWGWYYPGNYVHQGSMNSCWMLSAEEGVGVCTDMVCDEKKQKPQVVGCTLPLSHDTLLRDSSC